MNKQEFNRRWLDRASRYPDSRPLSGDRSVHIHVDPGYAGTYAGQVATITAASLFARMSQCVAVDVPSLQVLAPLPWTSEKLDNLVMRTLESAHKYGRYEQRSARPEDLRLVIGPDGDGLVAHGCGWGAFRGTQSSPLGQPQDLNPYGAAFAVIAAAAHLQLDPQVEDVEPVSVDTYLWQAGLPSSKAPKVSPDFNLGELWCIGVGSVGSSSLFFLNLITRAFHAVLVDRDPVKIENVTRSPLFSWQDALEGKSKVEVASHWLHEAGVERIESQIAWLDEIPDRWSSRRTGTPDILISAANEREVRSVIEGAFPPLQVYGTTGRNWQATLFRHIPMRDACSLCRPGGETPRLPALCATGSLVPTDSNEGGDDVALPFLSYAAGLMTAAEITKLALTGETATSSRVFFEPRTDSLVRVVSLNHKHGCVCQLRDATVHKSAIEGSHFAHLTQRPPV